MAEASKWDEHLAPLKYTQGTKALLAFKHGGYLEYKRLQLADEY